MMALAMLLAVWFGIEAQVTTDPSPLQEDSKNVTVYFHADQGNKGLMGQPASAGIYAHTGVCVTDASGKKTDWKYAPSWGDNNAKYRLEYVSPNLWKLNIGDIRTYYGVAANETIDRLAFVFRTADKSKEGKGDGNSDIFVDVLQQGLQIALTSNVSGQVVTPATGAVEFTVGTTQPSDIKLYVGDKVIGEVSSAVSLKASYTFPAPGDYVVKATATKGSETVSEELYYCYVSDSKPSSSSVIPPMGATRNADGSVTFCLAAPQKKSVIVVGSWNGYRVKDEYVMDYIDDPQNGARYFTINVAGLEKNTGYSYYYLVDGEKKVGDPYARLVLVPDEDKWIDPSVYPGLPAYPYDIITENVPLAYFKDNLNEYAWKTDNFKGVAKSDLIIYELLFRDFTGTEGKADANGTVRKAIEKIPYLKSLGVNAVELLPITEFNGNNSWGYNPNFYFAPDKAYGTPDDYKEFIDICHENGIAVILDVVFNQSDWLHPWYQMYEVGSNPFYNASAPHSYSVLNDWNQGFPLVQKQWKDMLQYWMKEYRFDGFRFDLVKGLGDNDSYASNSEASTNAFNASRVARMKELHAAIKEVNPDAYFINENLAGVQEENEMAADGELNWANVNEQGCQFAMGYQSNSALNRMYAPMDGGRTWGSTVSYLESHDEERLAYKQNQYGEKGVKGNATVSMNRLGCAAAQMIMTPGAHMIWMFSEMGNAQTTKNSGGNDTNPKIVDWSLMDKPANRTLLDSYRELIAIRTGNPELFTETAFTTVTLGGWGGGRYIVSKNGGKEIYTFVNPLVTGDASIRYQFGSQNEADYQILSKTSGSAPVINYQAGIVTVPANSYVVIATKNVSAVDEITGADSAMTVSVGAGFITVENSPADVTVYSIDGKAVAYSAKGDSSAISLSGGIYIVRSGSETVKVMVK